ncbi:SagB/ThcOx family dehydrogenase [Paenibacillus tepidiphilus]|uniref:SagB/ThcOx family dehydrogenase n=1 Tax=Paenibacillus tepidiphilus TaxID=2608683 RepID=UPI001239C83C|nr:SagB/ThcOx family dehydrogenase [Paenibacillus tepidiphilus]
MNKLEKNTVERSFSDYIYNLCLPKKIENYIIKFHQSSSFMQNKYSLNNNTNSEIYFWLRQIEKSDVLPEYYEQKIDLKKLDNLNIKGSFREYNPEMNFTFEELSQVINSSFGRDMNNLSKRYGSAGALYPVIPLLLHFKTDNLLESGAYVYHSLDQSLLKIKSWTIEEAHNIKSNVCFFSDKLPNTCIAYAIDIRRAIVKYHIRGYRHALIEVGAMSQVFKESLHQLKDNVGEVSWSGFNDNELSYKCGLNVRLCPIVMLQWFGHVKNRK